MNPEISRYFDNAATTPLDPRVLTEMLPFLREDFGNAHSIHAFGRKALAAVDLARQRVADLLGAEDPSQIVFTSGATESNNQVLRGFAGGYFSPFEHSAVRQPATAQGMTCLDSVGPIILAPTEPTPFISVMKVNNETGTIWNPESMSAYADCVHSDITQALGKVPVDVSALSFASFSAHKFYGPKGIGGTYFRDLPPHALLLGGEQEWGLRAGTLNVASIVGMGAAAGIAGDEMDSDFAHANELRSTFLQGLEQCSDWQINGGPTASPFILSLSFIGLEGETLVIEMDREGYALSSGAACSSRSTEPSHVLRALGIEETLARGTVRVSFGRFCTRETALGLSLSLRRVVEKFRSNNLKDR